VRGTPVDRYYIEHFLRRWNDPSLGRTEISGAVLEFQDPDYATLLGRLHEDASPITRIDVLDHGDNPRATIRADITDAPQLADASYDTVICTQVLHYIFDVRAAVATLARLLKSGGVLYITVPGISPYFALGVPNEVEHWRFTADSLRRVLLAHFEPDEIIVEAYGNVLASIGFLHGLAVEEFRPWELDRRDPSFPLLIAARAVRTE
jgi:SAM-dependent methyltransferase